MAYSLELKEEVKKRLLTEPAIKLSLEYKISLSTLYKWKKENILIEDSVNDQKVIQSNEDIIKLSKEARNLAKKGKCYEALNVINSIDKQDRVVEIQKASILRRIGTLSSLMEAKKIYEKYLDSSDIACVYEKVLASIEARKNGKNLNYYLKDKRRINNSNFSLSLLLTKLYCDDLSLEDIENSDISNYEKTILSIGYYERNNKKSGIKFVKEKKEEFAELDNELKIINILSERLKNNKITVFDITVYSKYLGCTVDSEKAVEIFSEKREKKLCIDNSSSIFTKKTIDIDVSTKSIKTSSVSKTDNSDSIISCIGKRVNSRYQNSVNSSNTTINKDNVVERKVLIKDVFKDEILEIGKYLYVKMQDVNNNGKAIKAWDGLQVLIDKPIDDSLALGKMIDLLKKIEELSLIEVSYNENKIKKYIKSF